MDGYPEPLTIVTVYFLIGEMYFWKHDPENPKQIEDSSEKSNRGCLREFLRKSWRESLREFLEETLRALGDYVDNSLEIS